MDTPRAYRRGGHVRVHRTFTIQHIPALAGNILVCQANEAHLSGIKALADTHREELGFITRGAFLEALTKGELLVALNEQNEVEGFVRYHHLVRKPVTTLYDICVKTKRCGIGRLLLAAFYRDCMEHHRVSALLRCIAHLDANHFYNACEWGYIRTDPGKRHPLNVWQYTF